MKTRIQSEKKIEAKIEKIKRTRVVLLVEGNRIELGEGDSLQLIHTFTYSD